MENPEKAIIPKLKRESLFPLGIEIYGLPIEISTASWPRQGRDDAGLPEARVFVAHDDTAIFLRYKVRESEVRAVNTKTLDPVWQDSCVEFFFTPVADAANPQAGGYYNLECNAIGTILYYFGGGRHERTPASATASALIQTEPSLGRNSFDMRPGPENWQVDVTVPSSAFFAHPRWQDAGFSGRAILANFYKCGDKLPRPHYLSWQKIGTENPDFHRPEFFALLCFE